VVIPAAVLDIRTRTVPSLVTVPGIVLGLVLWAADATPRQYAGVFAVVLLTFVAGFVLFASGILGGGDGKLLTCVAALEGPKQFGECLIWILVMAVVASMAILARRRTLAPLFRRLGQGMSDLLRFGAPSGSLVAGEPHRLPFALVVLLGTAAQWAAHLAGVAILG
jgi:Flp pilus assembly protein protease CpaA